jgi:hypothetical protein
MYSFKLNLTPRENRELIIDLFRSRVLNSFAASKYKAARLEEHCENRDEWPFIIEALKALKAATEEDKWAIEIEKKAYIAHIDHAIKWAKHVNAILND